MKKQNTAKWLMTVAMFIFGTLAPFVRNVQVSSGELALYRAVLAVVLVGGFLLFTRQRISLSGVKKELLLLLLSGAAMGINWILLFEAYKYTTVSVATLSYYFAPVIVMVVCPLLFKERITGKQILCFVMSTIGLVLITGTAGGGERDLLGIAFGLGAAVLYATVILLNKKLKDISAYDRTVVQLSAAFAVLVPYVFLTEDVTAISPTPLSIILLLVVGIIHTGLAYALYFGSMDKLPAQTVALYSYIDPILAVLLSALFLKESMSIGGVIGAILILGATMASELWGTEKNE
jgi:RarD protein